jgi:deoxycytidylate deaminase
MTSRSSKRYEGLPRFDDSELVIGLVGAVGTELDKVARHLAQRLEAHHYDVQHVRISRHVIPRIISVPDPHPADEYTRITGLMQAGNDARRTAKDNSILALGAASVISSFRKDKESPARRHAYIINSLKHPDEVHRLREIYPQGFYLLGIHSDAKCRQDHLVKAKRIGKRKAQELIDRDEDEHIDYGQRVADTFHLSDFFVNVDGHDLELRNSIWRILALLFGDPYKTPTFDEYAMFMAFVAALRSADLSRQVGAVIANNNKEIIATGANDCPRFRGGLYWPEFNKRVQDIKDVPKGRDYTRGYDSNKLEQQAIIDGIIRDTSATGVAEQKLREALEKSRIRDLTEFGRVVHAEMEALLSCGRSHASTVGATLYCTTFPCHNCAKHVIAAGIERVVYIEPYHKSRAIEFHSDAIKAGFRFQPFVGVGPRRFFDLFSMRLGSGQAVKRKNDAGHALEWKPENSDLRLQMLPLTYLDLELMASEMFHAARRKEDFENGK